MMMYMVVTSIGYQPNLQEDQRKQQVINEASRFHSTHCCQPAPTQQHLLLASSCSIFVTLAARYTTTATTTASGAPESQRNAKSSQLCRLC